MSNPTPYSVSYSFAGFQANAPTTPLPGSRLDTELAGIAVSVASLISAVTDIRRSDGALNDGVVTFDSLSLAVQLMMDPTNATLVANAVAAAQAAATAAAGSNSSAAASAATATTQANLAIAAAATVNLSLYLSKAGNLAGLGSVSTARGNLGLGTAAVLNVGGSASNIVQLDGSAKIPAYDGSQLTNIDTLPIGTSIIVNANAAPAGFLKENGALVSRATYSRLWTFANASGNITDEATYAASQWGGFSTGDLSTTFRLPDSRGEFFRGWDDGRGVDSGRVLGTRQVADNAPHTHGVTSNLNGASGVSSAVSAAGVQLLTGSSAIVITTQGAEGRPRNTSKLVCIKAY